MKKGCVKGHCIEMPVDIVPNKTIHQYVHFYNSGQKLGLISKIIIIGIVYEFI